MEIPNMSMEPRSLAAIAGGALLAASAITLSLGAAAETARAEIDESQRCLALTMYFEARGEGLEGMRAVGAVVLNRVESDEFPSTPCEVTQQGGESPPCQFSWWCDGKSDVPRETEHWEMALSLAAEMLENRGDDPTNGALFFHSAEIGVPWRIERTFTARIQGQVYYR
jgi:N-acetylmuramoyl-L-alanine amidase